MLIDMAHCTGCQTCVVACQMHNALRPGVAWNHVDTLEWGRWPDGRRLSLPHACLHCDEPPCVDVCPTGASWRREDGVVLIDEARCIGCGVCMTACPYGARTINEDARWFFGAVEPAPYEAARADRVGVAEKCTLCAGRIDKGQEPACVQACPVGIRVFGDLDDEDGPLRTAIDETGAAQVKDTALFYATGPDDIDVGATITAAYYAPSSQRDAGKASGIRVNPAVLATSSILGVTAVGAVGAVALRARAGRVVPEDELNRLRQAPESPEAAASERVTRANSDGASGEGRPAAAPSAGQGDMAARVSTSGHEG